MSRFTVWLAKAEPSVIVSMLVGSTLPDQLVVLLQALSTALVLFHVTSAAGASRGVSIAHAVATAKTTHATQAT
jgi:hypothetical protein